MKVETEIVYKFNEKELLEQLKAYIDSTYDKHYAGGSGEKIQAIEAIMDAGHGTGFCIGSIMKYAKRYGKKNGYNRDDLWKIVHFGLLQIFNHDRQHKSLE